MCKKIVITVVSLAVCLLLVSLPNLALANDDVLVTKSGSKYHQAGCSLVANKKTSPVSLDEAEAKGLTPCRKCANKEMVKESSDSDEVFITKSGSKYHTANCHSIKNRDKRSISLSDAQGKSLKPCRRCMSKGKKLSKKAE